jgi:hypothetical protein
LENADTRCAAHGAAFSASDDRCTFVDIDRV